MDKLIKNLSNPISTGDGGGHFEARVQASFVVLMLSNTCASLLGNLPIQKIKLQGRYEGYLTDDIIVFIGMEPTSQIKLLGQIKRSVSINKSNENFKDTIVNAWKDYNSPSFDKSKDRLALITGPLSKEDIDHTREILEWAKTCENYLEFFEKVNLERFSNPIKAEKLKVFQKLLNIANGDVPVSDLETYDFLRHFYILSYDLDIRASVTSSLLCAVLHQFSEGNAYDLWTKIVYEVENFNQNAGTITKKNLPDDILKVFQRRQNIAIPQSLISTSDDEIVWPNVINPSMVALAFVGKWNENNDCDKKIIAELSGVNYDDWISFIRPILSWKNSPLEVKNGYWRISSRQLYWQYVAKHILGMDLSRFESVSIKVLAECSPIFSLPIDDWSLAFAYDKKYEYSEQIREGLVEGLVLLSINKTLIIHESPSHVEHRINSIMNGIFKENTAKLWGSLNSLLPTLAEASPSEFLVKVDDALAESPCPYEKLFAQEGKGLFGQNYMTGLLWALEKLAWDTKLFGKVCLILGKLASRDPGGQWSNRPMNSLAEIFLPWFPHTLATIEEREIAAKRIKQENPEVAWNLFVKLLPNGFGSCSDVNLPKWYLNVSDEQIKHIKNVKRVEYWEQVTFYSDLMISLCEEDENKSIVLIQYLGNFSEVSFIKAIEMFDKLSGKEFTENYRFSLWNDFTNLIMKHKRFPDAWWSMSSDRMKVLHDLANKFSPTSSAKKYERLFSCNDSDLYESSDFDAEREKLKDKRERALGEIIAEIGIENIFGFVKSIGKQAVVGNTLGDIGNNHFDAIILPKSLKEDLFEFSASYIWHRYLKCKWEWVDQLPLQSWTQQQLSLFLCSLPFAMETWKRVDSLLGDDRGQYWANVKSCYLGTPKDYKYAVDSLLQFNRPLCALMCFYYVVDKLSLPDIDRSCRILNAIIELANIDKNSIKNMDIYAVTKLIEILQDNSGTELDVLLNIEWAFLSVLVNMPAASPKTLQKELATNPAFFCEIMQACYHPKFENPEIQVNDEKAIIATNGIWLLDNWNTVPGMQPDGAFSKKYFQEWFDAVIESCKTSGHLEIALYRIGYVLIHAPKDSSGLWINRDIAELLDCEEYGQLLEGYRMGTINSRGAHFIDPTGAPEYQLATKYNEKADSMAQLGFFRVEEAMRSIAKFYENEAERNKDSF